MMDWGNETVLRFLELYQTHPCLWDPKDPSYKNKLSLNVAWLDIREKLGEKFSVVDLKRKKESLMATYRQTKKKALKTHASGYDVQPCWYAFPLMDSFLGENFKRESKEEKEVDDYNQSEDLEDAVVLELDEAYETCTVKSDVSYIEEQDSFETVQETSNRSRYKRKLGDEPTELQQFKKQMDEMLETLRSHKRSDDDDECELFGRLVAKKLQKLTEERRDSMMIEINKLLYEERWEHNKTKYK